MGSGVKSAPDVTFMVYAREDSRMQWLRPLFLVLLLALPAAAAAQQPDVLTGRVIGPDGMPMAGVRVEAISLETEISRSILTDGNGRYMILFADGGGRYLLRFSFLGMATTEELAMRMGEEELLLTNIAMETQAISLDAITVRAQLPPPGRGQSGEQSMVLPLELLTRLPLPDLEPETLALMSAGVVSTGVDSLTERRGFSVGGMNSELNQITLDGSVLGEGGMGVPDEGIRRTQVTTSTFDPARGGFAGGQVNMTSARGNNRAAGSLSYRLDDSGLQLSGSGNTNPNTRHNLGGSYGGPLMRNKLFYNASFQLTRNRTERFALAANDPLAAQRSGVNADSISRFLSIMDGTYGFVTTGQTGQYNQFSTDIRLQGRVDWNIVQQQSASHTAAIRVNWQDNTQDSTRINALDLAQHGGESGRNNRLIGASLTSRINQKWTNNLNLSFSESWNESLPYVEMPEGMVRVTSEFEDGTRGSRTLVFGGNRNMPTEAYSRDLQLSNEITLLLPIGTSQLHRLKMGGSLQSTRDIARSTDNLFGAFTYASLADFEENRPDRYERALTERQSRTGRVVGGLYIGDTWRITSPLELTYGIRWDYSSFDQRPDYNPAVEETFDRRTDMMPTSGSFSPRLGFNYRIGQVVRGARPKTLSGGVGVFAGRAPTNIFSAALRQTGLPNAEQRLICIGAAVPTPDWDLYQEDPSAVPTTCADGGAGTTLSSRAPNVTVIAPNQSLPSSLRAEVSYRTTLPLGLDGNIRYTYNRGFGLWGYVDLNLLEEQTFNLEEENRPFFGVPTSIVQRTGAVSQASSRRSRDFAGVYEVKADRQSSSHQVAIQANGNLQPRLRASLNYTLGFTRDQGSGAFASVPIAGNPNLVEWGVSNNDRRHTTNLTLTWAARQDLEFSATSRISSGMPFTPIVNRDINGDGQRNDRAFVFDAATATDTMVVNGMARLMENVPGRVRECLRSQSGGIAARNSCREAWTQSFDMRANFRPNLPTVQRRVTISMDARNVLTGVDQVLHGVDNMKGWGEGQRSDANLLVVRSFDRTNSRFRYEINEGFGQARRGPNASRNTFSVTLSARMTIGGQPNQANRGFGPQAPFAGGFGQSPFGPLAALFRTNGTINVDSVLNAVMHNAVGDVLARRDSLALTAEQVTAITRLSDTLQAQLQTRRETTAPLVTAMLPRRPGGLGNPAAAAEPGSAPRRPAGDSAATRQTGQTGQTGGQAGGQTGQAQGGQQRQAGAGGQGGGGQGGGGQGGGGQGGGGQGGQGGFGQGGGGGQNQASPQLTREYQLEVQPQVDGARREIVEAMRQVERVLTPQQWESLPIAVRTAGTDRPRGAPGGGFNAVAALDRALANPLAVLLELRTALAFTPEQVTALETLSAGVQARLDARRTDLGKAFDGIRPDQQMQVFGQVQPQITAARAEVTAALLQAQAILTPEQWQQVPQQVRTPYQQQGGRGGAGGGGGGGGG
jgi:hypothetical protein